MSQSQRHDTTRGSIRRHASAHLRQTRPLRPPLPRGAAFTLVELTLVVVIISVMASLAAPRYGKFIANQRLDAAAARIEADLRLAQNHAKTSGVPHIVFFRPIQDCYTLQNFPDPVHGGNHYTVSLAEEPYGVELTTASFNGKKQRVFDGYGEPYSNGSVTIALGNYQKTISVAGPSNPVALPADIVDIIDGELAVQVK